MFESGGTTWDLVSLILSACGLALSGLVMFILNSFRSDIRDARGKADDLASRLGKLEGRVSEFHAAFRLGKGKLNRED